MSEKTTGGESINYTINYRGFAQQGWQCPLCKKVLAPFMTYCPFHDIDSSKLSATNTTGKVSDIK